MRSLRVAPVLCTLRFGCLVDLLGGADFRVAGTASAAPPLAGDALEVKLECLEVLNDLLRRFAASLSEVESRDCLGALFGELPSSRAAARKRAIACIASLSASLPDRCAYQPRMRDARVDFCCRPMVVSSICSSNVLSLLGRHFFTWTAGSSKASWLVLSLVKCIRLVSRSICVARMRCAASVHLYP